MTQLRWNLSAERSVQSLKYFDTNFEHRVQLTAIFITSWQYCIFVFCTALTQCFQQQQVHNTSPTTQQTNQ